jgi:hypothetical protein
MPAVSDSLDLSLPSGRRLFSLTGQLPSNLTVPQTEKWTQTGYRLWETLDVLPVFSLFYRGYHGDTPELAVIGAGVERVDVTVNGISRRSFSTGELDLNMISLVSAEHVSVGDRQSSRRMAGPSSIPIAVRGYAAGDTVTARTRVGYLSGRSGRKSTEVFFQRNWPSALLSLSAGGRNDGPHEDLERLTSNNVGSDALFSQGSLCFFPSFWKASSSTDWMGTKLKYERRQTSLSVEWAGGQRGTLKLLLYDVKEQRDYSGLSEGSLEDRRSAATLTAGKTIRPTLLLFAEGVVEKKNLERKTPGDERSVSRDVVSVHAGTEWMPGGTMSGEISVRSIGWDGVQQQLCPYLRLQVGETVKTAVELSGTAIELPGLVGTEGIAESYTCALSQQARTRRVLYWSRLFADRVTEGFARRGSLLLNVPSEQDIERLPERTVVGGHLYCAIKLGSGWGVMAGCAVARATDGKLSPYDPTYKVVAGIERAGNSFSGDLAWHLRVWSQTQGERGFPQERVEGYTEINADAVMTVLQKANMVLRMRNMTEASIAGGMSSPGEMDISFALQAVLSN